MKTILALSASARPTPKMRVVKTSLKAPTECTMKSKRPPMTMLLTRILAWAPPFSPATRTWVVAVASGNGKWPCISLTKYLRNGIRNRTPSVPPRKETMKILNRSKPIVLSSPRMNRAGRVKMAPATITPGGGADRLDDDVLQDGVLALEQRRDADGDDGDGDGGLEHLADLQPQEGGGGREDDGHDQAEDHGTERHFGQHRPGGDIGGVFLARGQDVERPFGHSLDFWRVAHAGLL